MALTRSDKLPALHPGVIFKKRVLDAHNISISSAAKTMRVNRPHLNNFVNAKVSVTVPFAMKLEKSTGISANFWLNMQKKYDLFIHRDLVVDCEPLYTKTTA